MESFAPLLPTVLALSDLIPRQRDRLARKSAVGYARAAADPPKLAALIADPDISGEVSAIPPTGATNLPRAISYTGALYSIGLPPEFIGTGRGLAEVARRFGEEGISRLTQLYPGLRSDMVRAARYASFDTASGHLAEPLRSQIQSDMDEVSRRLGIEIGPVSTEDRRYHVLLETVQPMMRQFVTSGEEGGDIADRDLVTEWICRLGRIRGSLG
jgi:phosphoenolpyruvate carboxylase